MRITDTDNRKVAGFQLHLQGPAQTWFCCLDADEKGGLESLHDAFETKYCVANNPPVLLVETEQFNSLGLLPAQQIEDYFSKIIEKGKKINKSDQAILLKFILFVRAGNCFDVHTALTSTKMGEAFGYCVTSGISGYVNNSAATVAAAARADSSADRINSLEKTVHKLGEKIEQLMVSPRPESYNSSNTTGQINSPCMCYNCLAMGHIKRCCNLTYIRTGRPRCNVSVVLSTWPYCRAVQTVCEQSEYRLVPL